MDMGHKTDGLTTKEAFLCLHKDIESMLNRYIDAQEGNRSWLKDVLHHDSRYTTLGWPSVVSLVVISIFLLLIYPAQEGFRYIFLPLQGFIVITLLISNLYLVVRENKLRHSEIPQRIVNILLKLKDASEKCNWKPENYPHLCSPFSPCITLQWTYRDGTLVNLPWALLVKGDIMEIRPGQQAPGHCVPIDDKDAPELQAREIYAPLTKGGGEPFSAPTARTPLPNKKYRLCETPYLQSLQLVLDRALNRPITYYNQERHLLMNMCIERNLLPSVAIFVIGFSCLRYIYLYSWVSSGSWSDMFILQLVSTVLPLLPLVFPSMWLVLHCLGTARVHAILHAQIEQQVVADPFDDTDLTEPNHSTVNIKWNDVKKYCMDVYFGRANIPSRSANLLHVLGSVTALCCVDKKGILSWPNPTAEKVFFLRNTTQTSPTSSMADIAGDSLHHSNFEEDNENDEKLSKSSYLQHDYDFSHTAAEVLDLTHDHASPFRLQFDDQAWKKHLNSLKPLGLAILLNTCNMDTQEHYSQFCAHVTCEAQHSENLVPVTNRRCLCELAKQIGFVDKAQDIFRLEEQLSTFRHVQPEMVRRDIKFARSLSMAKLKFPFPHMVSVVVRDTVQGNQQLMAQGTADLILDSCVEYWNGHDLCPLSAADRKKVQDFYQRSSLTAYCSAFAYRPLSHGVNSCLSKVYLELPADSKHLYTPHRSPTPPAWDPRCKGILGRFHSTDSLLGNDTQDDDICDVDGCFDMQCNQVFIGMVTMQYQAQIDMVQLIDQLERACIRFVHFSKENELRSRVFSEKMGLESGWNCHISLLSERNRSESGRSDSWPNLGIRLSSPSSLLKCNTVNSDGRPEEAVGLLSVRHTIGNSKALSFSAPSAINMDFSQVKFEDGINDWFQYETPTAKPCTNSKDEERVTSQDSMLVHSIDLTSQQEAWHSISCLTDSTEQSAPVNFDMSNRAKLPRGIDKIRPHLESIDNVPLLVSLFTDCTPSVTCEMLHIMQDYKEVVCVLGSSASADNMPIHLQADASLAVEPLYPQVCQKVPAYVATTFEQGPSPVELSRELNSVACSISFRREDPISIFHMIMEARHFMQCVCNCLQFWMCCVTSISFVQILTILFMLPPIFSTGQVLWLVCIIVPVLSLSLVGKQTDPQVMQRATGKNECVFNSQVAIFILWCYGFKFAFAMLATFIIFISMLNSLCYPIAETFNTTCIMVYPDLNQEWGGWMLSPWNFVAVQHVALGYTVFLFALISISFIHREYSISEKNPLQNKVWVGSLILIFVLQGTFSASELSQGQSEFFYDELISINTITIAVIAPFVIFIVNEFLIKRQEILANVRYQKRARLQFDTKLGMNSPF